MKLLTLAGLFVASISALAQTSPQPLSPEQMAKIQASAQELTGRAPLDQSGCPLVFTNVALKNPAHYLPVQTSASSSGNLGFEYKNQSGKEIQSIAVQIGLKAKKSRYDLDAVTTAIEMTLTGKTVEAALPAVGYVYGVERVTLKQITYADGTAWDTGKQVCQYRPNAAQQIGKLW